MNDKRTLLRIRLAPALMAAVGAGLLLGAVAAFAQGNSDDMEDPYIWLEDVEGEEALAWVERQNEQSVAYLESLPLYDELYERSLEILDSDDRIAYPGIRGDHVFNYWRDATNRRGLWRRTPVDDYVAGDPDWDVILDLDALAEAEGEDWVWSGAACLRPDYRICVLELSRGGSDAAVMREFDVENRAFVDDGFVVPEAKSRMSWIDSDALYIGTDFGEGTLTDSGYARTIRTWRRGEPLADATEIFAGEQTDVAANVNRRWDGDSSYDIAARSVSFYTSTSYLVTDEGEFKLIDIPEDASFERVFNGQMLVALKSDWTVGGETFVQGSLIAADFEKFLQGEREFHTLFVPTPTTALVDGGVTATRDYLILNVLEDVASRLIRYELRDGEWVSHDIDTEALGSIRVVAASDTSNTLFFSYENFLTPDTLFVSRDGGANAEALQSLPEFFDAEEVSVEQRFATSSDGTRIPYFVVLPAGFEANGDTPTLLYGYGGFEISLTPGYSSIAGHSWIARGGAYVIANIRGGGEYGPRWHQAALKENRQLAFDDFIAVAEDLIERGVTSPRRLGIRGGSNGGLLTGVMLTQRPDLWNAVIVQVPLLDMKRYNRLLAGASWMAEYGDPDTEDWEYISEYSPYQNVQRDADYPKPFFATSTRDDRVHPGHARKMVARMTEMGHDLLYFENTVGGHAGASDNTQRARNEAMIYSYLWDQLGTK